MTQQQQCLRRLTDLAAKVRAPRLQHAQRCVTSLTVRCFHNLLFIKIDTETVTACVVSVSFYKSVYWVRIRGVSSTKVYVFNCRPVKQHNNICHSYAPPSCSLHSVQLRSSSTTHQCTNHFTHGKDVHQYSTRSCKNSNLYRINANKSSRINSIAVRGPQYWNLLPVPLKITPSFSLFKVNLKEYLISQ